MLKDFVREAGRLGDFDVQGVNVGPAHGYFTVPTGKSAEVRQALESSEFNGISVKLDPVEHHVGRDRPRDDNGSRMRGRGGRPGGFSGGHRDNARPQGRPYNRSPRR